MVTTNNNNRAKALRSVNIMGDVNTVDRESTVTRKFDPTKVYEILLRLKLSHPSLRYRFAEVGEF